jgi:hypothetical protein
MPRMSNIRIQPDLYRKLKALAAENGRTVQGQVNVMLREWIAADKAKRENDTD